jgi:hypothetical protein
LLLGGHCSLATLSRIELRTVQADEAAILGVTVVVVVIRGGQIVWIDC